MPATSPAGNPDVHEYEQQGEDASTRRPVHNPLDPEAAALKAELDQLDRELAVMREGPFGPNSEFIRSFPADEREELLKALEEEGVMPAESADLISEEDLEDLAREEEGKKQSTQAKSPLKVTLSIPVRDKIYVKRFNAALETAQQKDDDKEYFALWKWYLRCQQHVSNFALIIPEDVWHFLWKSQSTRFYRPKHLAMLGKDMVKADVSLEDKEWVEYIDALQATGDIAAAAETWEAQRPRLGTNPELAELFWVAGIGLYVQLGKPQKAQRLAFECYEHTTMIKPELLVMVISAWAKSQHPQADVKTWYCYLELCRKLEACEDEKTRLDILGRVSSVLLEAGRPRLALAVFKDMFLLTATAPQNSWMIFRDFGKAVTDVHPFNEDLVSQIGLSALASFPQRFANKYFFTAWIKWLLGQGLTDDAALVVELMYERGIKPDAGPLNGLIAAWIRQGSPRDRQKAEETAWAMIQSRIDMVQTRSSLAGRTDSANTVVKREPGHRLVFGKRRAPAATVETFSILLQHYTRRSDLANASHLTDVMTGSAMIKPNSFIMNHWLYASLRSGQIADVWSKYSSLKSTIVPDVETFAALWDTAKASYASPRRRQGGFPDVRTLFAEMQEWFEKLEAKKRVSAQEDFSSELYEQIIRCFCLSSDPLGTLCALHGLKQSFNTLPHEEVSRLIIMQMARAYASDWAPPSAGARGLRMKKNIQYQSAVKTLTEIMVAISERMIQETDVDPEAVAEAESEQAQQLRLDVLTTFLGLIIEKRMKGVAPEDVLQRIMGVADDMKTTVPLELLRQRGWGDIEM
ncbi:pentatricopeptide repeat protein [Cladophialophora carrionii]|uniref:Pentatricopeptide repeat protein n=1 Tax=Cladophialophora carrionii TaxID=86049 RepID=A0A1C1CZX0_9EURO|nr:pentatricopeptide repeat protein [Cladophialophora carrionii]